MPMYALLLNNPAGFVGDPAETPRWEELTRELVETGVMRGGERLDTADTATTVRERDGEVQLTDGPFAETKEWLAGFYLIECDDLEQALELAAKVPLVDRGSVEVRPVMYVGGK